WGFGGPLMDYLRRTELLRCLDADPRLTQTTFVPTGNYLSGHYGSTYYFVAGTGNRHPSTPGLENRYFFGRVLSHGSVEGDPSKRAFICNLNWSDQSIGSYALTTDAYGPIYIDTPARQPAIVEPHGPNIYWAAFGFNAPLPLENQAHVSHRDGGNVVFMDGHSVWSKAETSVNRIQPYTTWAEIRY